jgi:hypothetical protein
MDVLCLADRITVFLAWFVRELIRVGHQLKRVCVSLRLVELKLRLLSLTTSGTGLCPMLLLLSNSDIPVVRLFYLIIRDDKIVHGALAGRATRRAAGLNFFAAVTFLFAGSFFKVGVLLRLLRRFLGSPSSSSSSASEEMKSCSWTSSAASSSTLSPSSCNHRHRVSDISWLRRRRAQRLGSAVHGSRAINWEKKGKKRKWRYAVEK